MKWLHKKILILVGTISLTACTSTDFTPYRGSQVFPAGAGAVKTYEGIDFWSDGQPDRPYTIVGIVEDDRPQNIFAASGKRHALIKAAKDHGGDAIIVIKSDSVVSGRSFNGSTVQYANGLSTTSGGVTEHHRLETKVAVIRYTATQDKASNK